MEPISLLVAAGAYLGAEAAKQVGDKLIGNAFDGIKGLWKKCFGRDPKPDDFTPAAVQAAKLDAQPAFVEQAREVVKRSSALRRAELVNAALNGAAVLWVDDHPSNNAYERQVLVALGIRFDLATTTAEALAKV